MERYCTISALSALPHKTTQYAPNCTNMNSTTAKAVESFKKLWCKSTQHSTLWWGDIIWSKFATGGDSCLDFPLANCLSSPPVDATYIYICSSVINVTQYSRLEMVWKLTQLLGFSSCQHSSSFLISQHISTTPHLQLPHHQNPLWSCVINVIQKSRLEMVWRSTSENHTVACWLHARQAQEATCMSNRENHTAAVGLGQLTSVCICFIFAFHYFCLFVFFSLYFCISVFLSPRSHLHV